MAKEIRRLREDSEENGRELTVYTGPILCYNSKVSQSNDDMSKQQDIQLATAAQAGDQDARRAVQL